MERHRQTTRRRRARRSASPAARPPHHCTSTWTIDTAPTSISAANESSPARVSCPASGIEVASRQASAGPRGRSTGSGSSSQRQPERLEARAICQRRLESPAAGQVAEQLELSAAASRIARKGVELLLEHRLRDPAAPGLGLERGRTGTASRPRSPAPTSSRASSAGRSRAALSSRRCSLPPGIPRPQSSPGWEGSMQVTYTGTASRTAPPSDSCRGTPASRARRSCSARSSAERALHSAERIRRGQNRAARARRASAPISTRREPLVQRRASTASASKNVSPSPMVPSSARSSTCSRFGCAACRRVSSASILTAASASVIHHESGLPGSSVHASPASSAAASPASCGTEHGSMQSSSVWPRHETPGHRAPRATPPRAAAARRPTRARCAWPRAPLTTRARPSATSRTTNSRERSSGERPAVAALARPPSSSPISGHAGASGGGVDRARAPRPARRRPRRAGRARPPARSARARA